MAQRDQVCRPLGGHDSGQTSGLKRIAYKKVKLLEMGQEVTVLRFKLDEDGELILGSLHDIPLKLRSGGK